MKSRIFSVLTICLLVFNLCACTTTKPEKTKTDVKDNTIKIGIVFDTFVLERWIRDKDVFVSTATKYDAEVDVQNSNGDVEKQKEQIAKFIEDKKDAIVIIATDCYKLTEVVNEAKSQGIKVISYDRLIQGIETDLYVTVDNTMVGRLMAEDIKSRLPDGGNIVMICGPEADSNSIDVAEGFEKAIDEDKWKIIYKSYVKSWTPEYGFAAVNEAFDSVTDIDAVMCGNDGLAGYAIRALSEMQRAGEVIVVGQDADLEACQRIVEGTQSMTVYKPIEELARVAAECTVKLVVGERINNGESVSATKTMDNGTEVRYYGLEPIAVNKNNMDEVIIDSKFHLREEVYLNMGE